MKNDAIEKKGASALSNRQEDILLRTAKAEGIPVTGLTILGGRAYVNVTGLDVKLRTKCDDEKLVHVGTEYVEISKATKENGMHASGWGIVRLFDKIGFEKALGVVSKQQAPTKEVIEVLRDLFMHVFKMRGFASPETLQMRSMQALDNVEHMAERRATNRAKREATGTGLTSLEEMLLDDSIGGDQSEIAATDDEGKMAEYRKIMIAELGRINITADLILDYCVVKSVDDLTLDHLKSLKRIFTEISFDAKKLLVYFPKAAKTETEREKDAAKSAVDEMMANGKKTEKPEKKAEEPKKRSRNDEMPTPEQGATYITLEAMIKKTGSPEKLLELSEKIADLFASKKLLASQADHLSKYIDRRKAGMK